MIILRSKMLKNSVKCTFILIYCIIAYYSERKLKSSIFWAKSENEIFWLLRGVAVARDTPIADRFRDWFFTPSRQILLSGFFSTKGAGGVLPIPLRFFGKLIFSFFCSKTLFFALFHTFSVLFWFSLNICWSILTLFNANHYFYPFWV